MHLWSLNGECVGFLSCNLYGNDPNVNEFDSPLDSKVSCENSEICYKIGCECAVYGINVYFETFNDR